MRDQCLFERTSGQKPISHINLNQVHKKSQKPGAWIASGQQNFTLFYTRNKKEDAKLKTMLVEKKGKQTNKNIAGFFTWKMKQTLNWKKGKKCLKLMTDIDNILSRN